MYRRFFVFFFFFDFLSMATVDHHRNYENNTSHKLVFKVLSIHYLFVEENNEPDTSLNFVGIKKFNRIYSCLWLLLFISSFSEKKK